MQKAVLRDVTVAGGTFMSVSRTLLEIAKKETVNAEID